MTENTKCAHDMCDCIVSEGETFCSEHCEDAKDQDIVEIKCDCGHKACQ